MSIEKKKVEDSSGDSAHCKTKSFEWSKPSVWRNFDAVD